MNERLGRAHSEPTKADRRISLLYFEAAQTRIKSAAELAEVRGRLAVADAKAAALQTELESIKRSYLVRTAAAVQSGMAWLRRKRSGDRNPPPVAFGLPVASSISREPFSGSLEKNSDCDAAQVPPRNAESYRSSANFASSGKQAWDVYGRIQLLEFLRGKERLSFPNDAKPALSIILVFHNKAHLSLLCMRSVQQNADVNYEVVVIDNASTDATSVLLKRMDNVTVVRNEKNQGFAPGCMQAVEHCRGEYLCFLNNDALLEAGSLSAALRNFEADPTVGAVGGKILLADGRLQEAGCILWCDGTSDGYGRGDDPDLPKYLFRRPVDYCSGVFLVTPRKLFQDIGGFDSVFFPGYFEDSDYCMRLWLAGFRVVYEPEAMVRHYENASTASDATLLKHVAANHEKFYQKWQKTLPSHGEPRGPNVHRARFAPVDHGLNILYIEDAIPDRHADTDTQARVEVMERLVRERHHVTCAVYGSPLGEDRYNDIPREVELLDATSDRDQVLADHLPYSDVVWISQPHNLEDVMARLLALGKWPAAIVVWSKDGVGNVEHVETVEPDLGIDDLGLTVLREEQLGISSTINGYRGEPGTKNGQRPEVHNHNSRIYFVTLRLDELGARAGKPNASY